MKKTITTWAEEYIASRVDHAAMTAGKVPSQVKAITAKFGDRDPFTITRQDVQQWIADLVAKPLEPSTIQNYVYSFRLVLDYVGVEPNPARDKRVKLPAAVREEPIPPTAKHFLALLDAVPRKWVLPMIVLEQTAMRIGEVESLVWGDVDVAEVPAAARRNEDPQGPVGAGARVADGRARADLPARGQDGGAAGVSRPDGVGGEERDGTRLHRRGHPSLPSA